MGNEHPIHDDLIDDLDTLGVGRRRHSVLGPAIETDGFAAVDGGHGMTYQVLDPCCGSRMMWFDPTDKRCLFCDIRNEHITGFLQHDKSASIHISPDVQLDFRNMPFPDSSFYHIVFDPPHLTRVGNNCWIGAKYGRLGFGWKEDLRQGFRECFRVLKPFGTLVFKWSETQVPIREVLSLSPVKPLYGNRNHQKSKTHWIVYIKPE